MDSLTDLISSCQAIQSEKATDRKKSIDKLKNLLNKVSVIKALDKSSDARLVAGRKDRVGYTWDDIFKSVCSYISIETSALQKSKETQSATALSNREKKKQEISGIFKIVVKQANKRGPRLKCSLVLKHLQDVLTDDFMCNAYGLDYSNILLKNILTVRKYWIDLTNWLELIALYCQMFRDPDCTVEKVLLSRLIRTLILGATVQSDLRPKRLLNFFTETFQNIRQERTTAIIENLLSALNIFLKSIAKGSRIQICKLGELVMNNILYLWDNRPSVTLKGEMVEFIHSQLLSHHPGGVKQGQPGAFAIDWDVWMSHLRKLYEIIYSDMQNIGGRTKFSGHQTYHILKSRHTELTPAYVELIVDLCHQLFGQETQVLEITQGSEDTQGPAKKRRLQTGWLVIREQFLSSGQPNQLSAWMQLVCRLINKYPHSFPEDECLPYLQCFSQILAETKQNDIMELTLQCVKAIMDNWEVFEFSSIFKETCLPSWRKIWASTLRAVSLHHAQSSGYQLLDSILCRGTVTPEKDIWSLFLPSISVPTTESVQFLITYIQNNILPERYQPSLLGTVELEETQLFPLRTQLLGWLFPYCNMGDNSSSLKRLKDVDPHLVAQAAALLMLKVPSSTKQNINRNKDPLTELESAYLQCSHDFPLHEQELTMKKNVSVNHATCITVLLKKLEEVLKEEAGCLMNVEEVTIVNAEDVAREVCLIVKLIHWLLKYSIVDKDILPSMDLILILKSLLKKLSTYMSAVLQNQGVSEIVSVLSWLRNTLDWTGEDESSVVIGRLLRSLMPSKIIEILLDLAEEKFSKGASRGLDTNMNNSRVGGGGGGRGRRSRILEDIDDVDLGFDDAPVREQELDDGFGDSQDSDEVITEGNDFEALFCISKLNESQKARVEAIRVLTLWCGYDLPHMKQMTTFGTDMDQTYIRSKVMEHIGEEKFDPSKPVDFIVMHTIFTNCTVSYQQVTDDNLDSMLEAIREVAKQLRNDHEVCCICLDLMGQLSCHLVDCEEEMISEKRLECRDSAVHLFNAFWKLQEEGRYSSKVRLAIAKCMMQFIKNDPGKRWIYLKSKDSDKQKLMTDEFIQGLSDVSPEVRMYTAVNITQLFKSGDGKPQDRREQDKMFDKIYIILNEDTLDIPGNLTPERSRDENENRTASVLTALGNILCVSPVCEKKTMFAMCQLIIERGVEEHQVQKVLEKASQRQGYRDRNMYISDHLVYILHHWLKLDYSIKDFPHKVAFCSTKQQFYKKFYHIVVPELIMNKQISQAKELVTAVGMDWKAVQTECIPKVVVHILPLFAASKSTEVVADDAIRQRTQHATVCYDLLSQEATREVVERTIVDNLDKIVVNILMCLYDTEEDDFIRTDIIKDMDPEPNPPCFNTYMIKSTLDYLTKSFPGNMSLVEVLSKKQNPIQKILLNLAVTMATEHRLHEKRRILLMYRLFCKMLFREFENQLGGCWAFVMREVVHRLIYITLAMVNIHREQDLAYKENICCTALELLRDVCSTTIEVCPQEFEKYLPFIVSNLTFVAETPGDIGDQALGILRMVVFDNYTTLKQGLVSLDPFPNSDIFKDLLEAYNKLKFSEGTFNLKQEIEHFLALCGTSGNNPNSRKDGLTYLSHRLTETQGQILQFVKDGQGAAADNVLCRLICQLVQMVQRSNQEVKVNIACCLGEIGPIDMATIALPAPQDVSGLREAKEEFSDDVYLQNYCAVFHMLNQYLVDDDVELVQAASSVLKSILSTKTGIDFSNIYSDKLREKDCLFQYLHPFRSKKKTLALSKNQTEDQFCQAVDSDMLWVSTNSDHTQWIQTLTKTLITSGAVCDEVLALLAPICERKTEFCEMVLPYLVHDIIVRGSVVHKEVLTRQCGNFFSSHCSLEHNTSPTGFKESTTVCYNKDSVRTMLKVIQYLRQQGRPKEGRREMTSWDNNFWLDLNYLHVAEAAQYCSAHFTTILYSEIWCDKQQQEGKSSSQGSQQVSQSFTQDTRIDSVSSASSEAGISMQDLLMEAYQQIGDPDGLYGCGASKLADSSSRVKIYQHENLWDKAVITHDIEMTTSTANINMLQAVQSFGALNVLETYFEGMSKGTELAPNIKELQYQAAWKAGQWSLDPVVKCESYHQSVYSALMALKDDHSSLVNSAVDTARLCVIQRLSEGSMESSRSLYPMLTDLHCLSQIQTVVDCNIREKDDMKLLVQKWSVQDEETQNDFDFVEPVYSMRISLLKILHDKTESEAVSDCLNQQLIQLVRLCRETHRHQLAERAMHQLKNLEASSLGTHMSMLIEEAKMYWARQEQDTAKHLMKDIISQLSKVYKDKADGTKYYAKVLSIYGNWLAETRSENPNVIMEEYLEKTVGLLEAAGEEDDIALEAYLSLARYADSQYQHIVNYMKSNTYEAKCSLMKKAQAEILNLQRLADTNKQFDTSKDRYFRIMEKQSKIDRQELESMKLDRSRFLIKAVENYVCCLKCGDKHDLRIFRLTSLWFNNAGDEDVMKIIKNNISDINSYKFLPLMYQLAARMDTKSHKDQSPLFQKTLNGVIERSVIDHPHHALFCVLALAHAKKDADIFKNPSSKKGRLSRTMSDAAKAQEEGRIESARNLIQKLKSQPSVADIVNDMEKLCVAYIQLANYPVMQYKNEKKAIPLPDGLSIKQMKNLTNISVPTAELSVDKSGNYDNITYIKGFQPTFKLAGGVNLPKIISCTGSDGRGYRQLVKGRDDLRQDAVMQQVFSMVNNLLKKNPETRKRRLQIRKYKVIPLSQCSGLLEWCEGTLPLGEYLIGGSSGDEAVGAHHKYRPQDQTAIASRKQLNSDAASPLENRYKVFLEVCKKFQPVFRHFFMEKFPEPSQWFERRLAYTKSVATNSIVGYILGLGDRHVQNILIDCNTAEMVHIDLGVAFEQGKILPTPEVVPFRLTRDILDGMGVSGAEGVFRRCCEKTMEVMHNNQEALLTILEVLLYDPLYAWSMSPAKAYALQHRRDRNAEQEASELNATSTSTMLEMAESSGAGENPENVNKLAERVLLRLQQKLQGIEDGVQLSVGGQVNLLIQEARNPKNLCRLYHGWQPYL